MARTVIALATIPLTGCTSASRQIARSVGDITSEAAASRDLALAIAETSGEEPTIVAAHIIAESQDAILAATVSVYDTLPGVVDVIPWWAQAIGQAAIAASLVALAFILWHTGVGSLIKRALWSIGWLIPKSARLNADLDRRVADPNDDMTAEGAARVRAKTDPAYAAAARRCKKGTCGAQGCPRCST
jgi:hypothetical protein